MIFRITLRSEPLLSMKTLLIKKAKNKQTQFQPRTGRLSYLLSGSGRIFSGSDLTKIWYRIRENARYFNGKLDFTGTWEAGFVRNSGKLEGCMIFVEKEQECGIRTLPPPRFQTKWSQVAIGLYGLFFYCLTCLKGNTLPCVLNEWAKLRSCTMEGTRKPVLVPSANVITSSR